MSLFLHSLHHRRLVFAFVSTVLLSAFLVFAFRLHFSLLTDRALWLAFGVCVSLVHFGIVCKLLVGRLPTYAQSWFLKDGPWSCLLFHTHSAPSSRYSLSAARRRQILVSQRLARGSLCAHTPGLVMSYLLGSSPLDSIVVLLRSIPLYFSLTFHFEVLW
ncbi:hypothetical protein BKA80DRAFT_38466 [Phyllosticta citrichinensis]